MLLRICHRFRAQYLFPANIPPFKLLISDNNKKQGIQGRKLLLQIPRTISRETIVIRQFQNFCSGVPRAEKKLQSGCPENVLCAIVVQTIVSKVFLNIHCGIDFQMHFFVELWFSQLTYIFCDFIYRLCFVYVTCLGHKR